MKATATAGRRIRCHRRRRRALEAQIDLFELIATMHGGSLGVYLGRFDAKEFVVGATIDVETATGSAAASGDIYRHDAP